MMTRPMLRDAALASGLALALGWVLGGAGFGLEAAVCALLAVGNLAVHRLLVTRLTADLAAGGDGGPAGTAMAGKLVATLLIVAALLVFVDAGALALGLASALGVAALAVAFGDSLDEATSVEEASA